MRNRTENWRDLLSSYAMALEVKKIGQGLIAVLGALIVLWAMMLLYAWILPSGAESVVFLGTKLTMWKMLLSGDVVGPITVLAGLLPLLDPFHGASLVHFLLSVVTWVLILLPITWKGGVISRIAALEYARDDLPTLREAKAAVNRRWTAYWLAPVMPLLFAVFFVALNAIGGLVASIPYVGDVLLIVPGFPMLLVTSSIITFLLVLAALSFNMMMPAISAGGKDAFDGWATAYSYVIWGLRKFVVYTIIVGLIGWLACGIVFPLLVGTLVKCLTSSVQIGYVREAWLLDTAAGGWTGAIRGIFAFLLTLVWLLVVAYAVSYYFTSGTIMFFLLRKDQDNIDVDELYEELEDEEDFEDAAAEALGEEDTVGASEVAAAEEPAEGEAKEAGDESGEDAPEDEASADEETVPDEDIDIEGELEGDK